MAFARKTWTDRVAEFINRRTLTYEDGTEEIVTVARNEGSISAEGDAFNAETMNDFEQRIADGFAEKDFPNGEGFYPDYQDGKYGYNTSEERGADTFHPFSSKPELVGTYTGNQTLSLEALGYPDATAEDFLVVLISAPATNHQPYYVDFTNYFYYSQIGSTAITPTRKVSGGNLVVSGMTYYAYFKNTHNTNNYTWQTPVASATWQLIYIG